MRSHLLGVIAYALAPIGPAAALDIQSTPVPGRTVPSLGNGEIAINRADRTLFFKNVDGTIGRGSLMDATAAGRRAVEQGRSDDQTVVPNASAAPNSLAKLIADGGLLPFSPTSSHITPWRWNQVISDGAASGQWEAGQFIANVTGSPKARARVLTGRLMSRALFPTALDYEFDAQHVAVYGVAIRELPAGGVPSARIMAPLWGYWGQLVDKTNLPSSTGNALLNEFDGNANGRDDGNSRSLFVDSIKEWIGVGAAGGYPLEWACARCLTSSATTAIKVFDKLAGYYSIAGIDLRASQQQQGTVQVAAAAGSTTVNVSNVVGFMSAGVGGDPVSASNPLSITLAGKPYTVTDAQFDAPVNGVTTTNGTLTLSTPIVGTDGAVGSAAIPQGRTIWLKRGKQIAYNQPGTLYETSEDDTSITTYGDRRLTGSQFAAGTINLTGNNAGGAQTSANANGTIGWNMSSGRAEVSIINNITTAQWALGVLKRTSPSNITSVFAAHVNGYPVWFGSAPTATGCTVASGSNPARGTVTVSAAGATSCTVTWAQAWQTAPFCTLTSNSVTVPVALGADPTTTALVINFGSGASATQKATWQCAA